MTAPAPGHALGIVVALEAEARILVAGGARIAVSGPGPDRAAAAAERLLAAGCNALLSFGVAAGVVPGPRAGDIVIASAVRLPDAPGPVCADAHWRAALLARCSALEGVTTGTIVSAREVLATPADKRAVAALGDVADMESGAVAAVARDRGARWLAVRAVVDPAEVSVPRAALAGIGEDGASAPLALVRALLARPLELPAVVGLGVRFAKARSALRRLAQVAGPSFSLPAQSC